DDYYPFGLTFNSYSRENSVMNRYLYNGVELNGHTGEYETRFRGYDPALGRFGQVDPLAGIIPGISPYHFGYNNPVKYADPLGLIGETDIWGRDRFDSFTGMYIPPDSRPGGTSCSGCGDMRQGNWEAESSTSFDLDYSTHTDTDQDGEHDYHVYTHKKLSTRYRYKCVFSEFDSYSTTENGGAGGISYAGRNDGVNPFQIAWGVNGIFQMGTEITVHGPKPKYTGPGDWAKQVKLGKNFTKKLGVVGIGITLTDAAVRGQ